jgi:hypothetical protein
VAPRAGDEIGEGLGGGEVVFLSPLRVAAMTAPTTTATATAAATAHFFSWDLSR